MKKIATLLFITLSLGLFAQKNGHNIEIKITDLANSQVMIAYHMQGKHYISDTLEVNEKGIALLKGDEPKEPGVYLCVFPSLQNKYFEFIIREQNFSMEVASGDIHNTLKFKNSEENELFYSDMGEMSTVRTQVEGLKAQIVNADEKRTKTLEDEINKLNKEYTDKRIKLAEDNPDFLYSALLGMMREIKIPDAPVDEQGNIIDSTFQWKYYKHHFWDYTDFSNAGILRTPVFHGKMEDYIDKRTSPHPDSLAKSCDILLEKASANDDVFQYVLVTLVNKFANSKVMGQDGIYVHLVENYYNTGKAWWVEEDQLEKMKERVTALKPLLIDVTAPDLTLRDTSLAVKYRLHDLPHDYVIVFVWDPECGHCKKAMPALKAFYDKYKDKSVMVYAISTVNYENLGDWKDFVKENNLDWLNVADPYNETNFRKIYDISSTPQLYILDNEKTIVGKRIGTGQLEDFFYNYWKRNDPDKAIGMEKPTPHIHDHDGDGVPDHDDHAH
ncbi:MAG: thioredoxin-like domain-containing protein [Chitinophagales bacterium]